MTEPKLYAVALLTVRLDPGLDWTANVTDGRGNILSTRRYFGEEASTWNTDITVEADAMMALSEEEAKEICLRLFRERYPESEGWASHGANTQMIDLAAFVKQAVDNLRDLRYAKWSGGVGGADDDAVGLM